MALQGCISNAFSETHYCRMLCFVAVLTLCLLQHISTGPVQRTKKVSFVPGCLDPYRVILTTDRDVKLHTVGCSPDKMLTFEGGEARQIRLTCSDTTTDLLACGVSGYGFDTLSEGCKVSNLLLNFWISFCRRIHSCLEGSGTQSSHRTVSVQSAWSWE